MEAIKWTDRKFTFGYDKGYTSFFIERLRATAPRLEELFSLTDDAEASVRPGNDWSVKEHAGHLSDLEVLHDGRIDDFLEGFSVLRAADMTNGVTNDAGHNNKSLSALAKQFRVSRDNFIARIGNIDEPVFDRKALHPRLKQMITLTDLLFFVAEHDVHHLAKIAALVKRTS